MPGGERRPTPNPIAHRTGKELSNQNDLENTDTKISIVLMVDLASLLRLTVPVNYRSRP